MDSRSWHTKNAQQRYLEIEAEIMALPADEQLPRALKRIRYLEAIRAEQNRQAKRGYRWYDILLDFALFASLTWIGMWAYSKGTDSTWFSVFLGSMIFLAGGRIRRWFV